MIVKRELSFPSVLLTQGMSFPVSMDFGEPCCTQAVSLLPPVLQGFRTQSPKHMGEMVFSLLTYELELGAVK